MSDSKVKKERRKKASNSGEKCLHKGRGISSSGHIKGKSKRERGGMNRVGEEDCSSLVQDLGQKWEAPRDS